MHFEISTDINNKFSSHYKLMENLYLSTDLGWEVLNINNTLVYFKGYQTSFDSHQDFINEIINNPVPRFKGLFIGIICKGNTIELTFDVDRGTHIYYSDNKISTFNLENNLQVLPPIQYIIIDNYEVTFKNFDPLEKYLNFEPLSEDEVFYSIDKVIENNFNKILPRCMSPILVMITGGLDTLLAFSYLKKYTSNYKILTYEHIDFTEFICKNWRVFKTRNNNEGFLHFHGTHVILGGGWGDERLLRDPRICNLNFKLNNTTVLNEIENYKDSYQYLIAQTPNYLQGYEDQKNLNLNKIETFKEMYSINLHVRCWGHVENNIYFHPLKDLEITNLMLRLPFHIQKQQMFDGYFHKKLIYNNDPNLLKYVSKYKNYNCFENVYKFHKDYNASKYILN